MKIPETTKKHVYYIAISMTEAYSSWPSLKKAHDAWDRMIVDDREAANRVIGIVQTTSEERELICAIASEIKKESVQS